MQAVVSVMNIALPTRVSQMYFDLILAWKTPLLTRINFNTFPNLNGPTLKFGLD